MLGNKLGYGMSGIRSFEVVLPCLSSLVFKSCIPWIRVLSKIDQLTFLCVAQSLATSVSISALNSVEKVRLSWLLLSSMFLRISALADIVVAGCEEVAERKLLP